MDLDLSFDFGAAVVMLMLAAVALVAAVLARYSISSAFTLVVLGAIFAVLGLGAIVEDIEGLNVQLLIEITLALVLFGDAARIDIQKVRDNASTVARLLVIGLSLTIVGGTVLALGLFPGISVGMALLIGAALAPTDAALGAPVVADESVPTKVRRLLNIESGLNDGVAAPLVTFAIAMATAGAVGALGPVGDAIIEFIIATVIGVVAGVVGGRLLLLADARRWTSPGSRRFAILALALGVYFVGAGFGVSGFIAAFFAGLIFNATTRSGAERAVSFTEEQGNFLALFVWLAFGMILIDQDVLGGLDGPILVYALVSLTLLRMVPVALALIGTHFDRVTIAFMGWFGPRGLASIVFALLGLQALHDASVDTGPLIPVVGWTVLLSVILHGFTAKPLAAWYGRYMETLPSDSVEFSGEGEPRVRDVM